MSGYFRRYWLAVIIWAAMIFSVSSVSLFPKSVQSIFSFDYIPHALEYAVLGFLLARAFRNSPQENFRYHFRIFAVLCALMYGASDEVHQMFVPFRTASVIDVLYDGVGALIGQMVYKKRIIDVDKENEHG